MELIVYCIQYINLYADYVQIELLKKKNLLSVFENTHCFNYFQII